MNIYSRGNDGAYVCGCVDVVMRGLVAFVIDPISLWSAVRLIQYFCWIAE